jgi:hypothetical protein
MAVGICHADHGAPSEKVGANFANKWWLLCQYSLLANSNNRVFYAKHFAFIFLDTFKQEDRYNHCE